MLVKPIKPFKSVDEQLALLSGRGMIIDPVQGRRWLRAVGYYRLSGYWYPFRRMNSTSDPHRPVRLDEFEPATNFDEIVRLYELDRKLRTMVHDGIERIEVALRSHVGHVLGRIDPMAHTKADNFRDTFDHESWLATAERRIDRARRHHVAIGHHIEHYGGNVPIWVLTDVLDFSDVSRLFAAMTSQHQTLVTREFGFDFAALDLSQSQLRRLRRNSPLKAWFEQLTVVRNFCAHHGRIWNATFTPAPTTAIRQVPELAQLPEGQSERLFGTLAMMGYLLNSVSPGSSWRTRVATLIEDAFDQMSHRHASEMGFPDTPSRSMVAGLPSPRIGREPDAKSMTLRL